MAVRHLAHLRLRQTCQRTGSGRVGLYLANTTVEQSSGRRSYGSRDRGMRAGRSRGRSRRRRRYHSRRQRSLSRNRPHSILVVKASSRTRLSRRRKQRRRTAHQRVRSCRSGSHRRLCRTLRSLSSNRHSRLGGALAIRKARRRRHKRSRRRLTSRLLSRASRHDLTSAHSLSRYLQQLTTRRSLLCRRFPRSRHSRYLAHNPGRHLKLSLIHI